MGKVGRDLYLGQDYDQLVAKAGGGRACDLAMVLGTVSASYSEGSHLLRGDFLLEDVEVPLRESETPLPPLSSFLTPPKAFMMSWEGKGWIRTTTSSSPRPSLVVVVSA